MLYLVKTEKASPRYFDWDYDFSARIARQEFLKFLSVVSEFSQRHLSYQEDALKAVTGVANVLSYLTGKLIFGNLRATSLVLAEGSSWGSWPGARVYTTAEKELWRARCARARYLTKGLIFRSQPQHASTGKIDRNGGIQFKPDGRISGRLDQMLPIPDSKPSIF